MTTHTRLTSVNRLCSKAGLAISVPVRVAEAIGDLASAMSRSRWNGAGYPAPFDRLRDIALDKSAIASATLTGTEITSPALLKSRFTDADPERVWVVTGASTYTFPKPSTPMGKEKLALLAAAGMHVLHRWQAGEVMLTLYGT